MRKAIITIATGDHRKLWDNFSRHWWELYAKRHGYDIHVFGEDLVDGCRSVYLAKYAAVTGEIARGYDLVVWIDADVVVNHLKAPCLSAHVTQGRVSICPETSLPANSVFERARQSLRAAHRNSGDTTLDFLPLYQALKLEPASELMFNTGVFAFLTEGMVDVVAAFPTALGDKCDGPYYDQIPFTHFLTSQDRHHFLDERFNVIWAVWRYFSSAEIDGYLRRFPIMSGYLAHMINTLNHSWCLHFAGRQSDLNLLRGMATQEGLFRMNAFARRHARLEIDDWAPVETEEN